MFHRYNWAYNIGSPISELFPQGQDWKMNCRPGYRPGISYKTIFPRMGFSRTGFFENSLKTRNRGLSPELEKVWPWPQKSLAWPWPWGPLNLAMASKITGHGLGLANAGLKPIPAFFLHALQHQDFVVHFTFVHIFANYWLIFKVLWLAHSADNLQ